MAEYAMYLRKSRADAEAEARGEGETLARHQAMLTELSIRLNLNVTQIYKEIISGDSIASRPQMQQLLEDVEKKKYTGVLVVEIERLARGDTIDQGIVAQAFKNSSTKIITPAKTYDPDNEFDEEYFEFSLFMSRREYKTIKRRMQAGRLESVKEGNYIGQGTPYGYRKIAPEPKVHTLEIVPDEAEVIKMIFNMYLNGKGAKAICTELNRMGIPPQKSRYWEAPSIKKILDNPIYAGKVRWRTKASGDTLYEGKHQSIISGEIFLKVQEKRRNNPAVQIKSGDVLKNYYSGIIFCQNCGHQLKRREVSSHEHLLCTYRQCRGKVVSTSFETVNEAVLSAVIYRIRELGKLENNGFSDSHKQIETDIKKPLLSEIARIKNQQSRLHDLLEQDIYDINTFRERSQLLTEKLDALNLRLNEISTEEKISQPSPEEAVTELPYVIERFDNADAAEKNALLKSIIRKIMYTKTQKMCYRSKNSDMTLKIDFL